MFFLLKTTQILRKFVINTTKEMNFFGIKPGGRIFISTDSGTVNREIGNGRSFLIPCKSGV